MDSFIQKYGKALDLSGAILFALLALLGWISSAYSVAALAAFTTSAFICSIAVTSARDRGEDDFVPMAALSLSVVLAFMALAYTIYCEVLA